MYQTMLRRLFVNLKSGTEHLNYGREIVARWGGHLLAEYSRLNEKQSLSLLDLGCGHGTDLENIITATLRANVDLNRKDIKIYGVESYPPYVKELKGRGIQVLSRNIERESFPLKDASVDLVVANQVLEHTKEIFWITSEVVRILKPGGSFIVGVPNLASLHNRLLLLMGRQPTQIQSLSAHVRGFTLHDLKQFMEAGNFLQMEEYAGSNFYPFPPKVSVPLSRLFPTLSWGIFVRFMRTSRHGNFLEFLEQNPLETNFYRGKKSEW